MSVGAPPHYTTRRPTTAYDYGQKGPPRSAQAPLRPTVYLTPSMRSSSAASPIGTGKLFAGMSPASGPGRRRSRKHPGRHRTCHSLPLNDERRSADARSASPYSDIWWPGQRGRAAGTPPACRCTIIWWGCHCLMIHACGTLPG